MAFLGVLAGGSSVRAKSSVAAAYDNRDDDDNVGGRNRSHREAWMVNLGRGDDDAWLAKPRGAKWYTGMEPKVCPGEFVCFFTGMYDERERKGGFIRGYYLSCIVFLFFLTKQNECFEKLMYRRRQVRSAEVTPPSQAIERDTSAGEGILRQFVDAVRDAVRGVEGRGAILQVR